MDSRQKQIGEARSSERIGLQCSVVLASGMHVGEGQVPNMSGHGCLVESTVPVKVGDHLQLRLSIPGSEPSMRVSRAAVCWAQGLRFGVEFIGMKEKDRARLNHVVTLQGIHGQHLTTSSGLGKMPITVFGSHRELSLPGCCPMDSFPTKY